MNKSILNTHSSNSISTSIDSYIYSGRRIVEKISEDDCVIDIGCGNNQYKGLIKKLHGIDSVNKNADYLTTIENFKAPTKYDVAICFESINYGDYDNISNQIRILDEMLHPCASVFWRLNTTKYNYSEPNADLFPWTFEILNSFAKEYNFEQIHSCIDTNAVDIFLYAEWVRGFQPEI